MRKNSATPELLTIPLPPGAQSSDDWTDWGCDFRVISTPDWTVSGANQVVVYGSALQRADGTIEDGTGDLAEAPKVWVSGCGDAGLTGDQARELATLLIRAANTIDGWSAR